MTVDRRVRVLADWQYVGCGASGKAEVADNICCNRKCDCAISGQKVSQNYEELIEIEKLTVPGAVSYSCSRIELDECQTDCLQVLQNHLTLDRPIDFDLVNLNLLDGSNAVSQQVSFEASV